MMLQFWVMGDMFKVSKCGQWVSMWTGENWHVNPIDAWSLKVRTEADNCLVHYGLK